VESGNLPVAFTSFVGRRHEAETACTFGKAFPDGVWMVDLASVHDPAAVTATVAGALRMPDLGVRPAVDQLTGYLSQQRALLILDDCEHLVDACAGPAQALLAAAPELCILATSRHTLGVTGEHVLSANRASP